MNSLMGTPLFSFLVKLLRFSQQNRDMLMNPEWVCVREKGLNEDRKRFVRFFPNTDQIIVKNRKRIEMSR